MVVEYDHPKTGRVRSVGFPIKFSEAEFRVREHPPLLGEHNQEILTSLGLSQAEIEQLEREKIV
jgi:crotonobetainyl-CoA:carnitine CoA-transferase CaiB-like acyl-CoA transferase